MQRTVIFVANIIKNKTKKVQMVHSDLTEAPRNRMQRMLYYLFKMFALRIIYTNIIL